MEKPAEKKPFVIEIIEAKGLSMTKFKKLPSAFVKITVEKVSDKTRTFASSSSPSWKRSFLIPDLQVSSMLSLQVFHDGGVFNKNEFLGGFERPISDLLKISRINDHDIVVKLEALEDKRNIPDRGYITLRLESDFGAAASRAVSQTVKIGSATSAPKILTVFDSAPDSSAVISAAQNVLAPLQTLLESLNPIVEILNELAKVHPFASLAWVVVSSLYKIPKAQVVRDQSVIELCETIADCYSTAKKARVMDRITELKEIIDKMIHQTVECAVFIQEYFDRGFGNRLIHDMISNKSAKIGEFNNVFSKLKRSFEGELGLQIACVSLRSADKIDDLTRMNKLDQLKPVEMLTANRPRCLPSTRLQLIDFITLWATDPSPEQHKNVLWLWGFSGSGKSTLAMTIADMFWKLGRVGAFLFFDRKLADPNMVIRTLAYKLALFDDQIGEKVASAIDRNRDIIQQSFSEQFLKLIVEPLQSVDPLRITGPILIILDALDECGDEKSRELLLSALAQGSANLPLSLRFLVTSRPEQDIREVFDPLPHILPHELDTTSESNIRDISLFIQYRMREITKDQHWPERKQIDELATKAAGLFIWASTACEFIKGTKKNVNHDKLLKLVLSNPAQVEGQKSIDALYSTVLDNLLDWDDEADVKEYHSIIGAMVVAKTPLSAKAITALHKIDDPSLSWDAFEFVHPLSSLLSGTNNDTAPLRPLHKSFDDFLTDDKRSAKRFFIDKKKHSGRLARLCLNRMILLERMSSNDEPLKLNSNVNLKTHPPEDLQYACRFWSEHLIEGEDDSLYDLISIFAGERLLSWIEQLAITGDLDSAIGSLVMAKAWLDKLGSGNNNVARLLFDAERLVRAHFVDINEFPSCVYTTALPFSPNKSLIRQTYQQALAGRINVVSGVEDEWGPCLLSIELNFPATCVAWSHDNAHVVGGLSNGIVVVHSTQTGSLSLSYTGHQVIGEEAPSPILAVAFSSDDCYILSASANGFLHKWDISGKILAQVDCGPLNHVSFTLHLGGYAACVSDEGTLQLRELEQLTVTTVPIPETETAHVIFSPYGSETPAMAYVKGGSLCMWDLVKSTNLWVFQIDSLELEGEGGYISDDDDEPFVDSAHEPESYDTQEPTTDDPQFAAADVHESATDDNKSTSDSNIETAADDVMSTSDEIKSTSNDNDTASDSDDYVPAFDKLGLDLEYISVSKTGYVACTLKCYIPIFVLRSDGTLHGWLSAPEMWKNQRYTPAPIKSLIFSPDGTHLLVGHSWTTLIFDINDSVIRIWSVESCDLIAVVGGHIDTIKSLAFPPRSEHRFASTSHDKTIRIWDLKATLTPVSLDAHRHGSGVFSIAFSPDGKQIVTTSYDRDIKVWDAESGSSRTISAHHSWVLGVSFAPDSNTFATCALDDCMMIWQTESLECLQTIDTNSKPYNLAHSPSDGSLIAAGHEDHSLCVWDVADIKQPKLLLNTIAECFGDLVGFSMDGKYVASVGTVGRGADVWDIETSVLVLHIQGVEGGLFFSNDSTRLVTLHPEIKIWSIKTGQLLQTLPDLTAQLTLSPAKQGYLRSLDPQIFDVSQFVQQHVVFTALSPFSLSDHWILDRNGKKIFRYKGERNAVSWGQKIAFGRWDGVVTIIHIPDENTS